MLKIKFMSLFMRLAPKIYPKAGLPLSEIYWQLWYQFMSKADKQRQLLFLNYGFVDLDPNHPKIELKDADEPNRFCIQMYHKVASAIDLKGLDVLEIACGRGGGAAYITEYLKPKNYVGVDLSKNAIEFCCENYHHDNLSFIHGNAESLPFGDGSFDAIVNVEASHRYLNPLKAFQEVRRLLRPGGYLLFSDFRGKKATDELRGHFNAAGLAVVKEEKITASVFHSLELENERKLKFMHSKIPKYLHSNFRNFSGIKGEPIYKQFETGNWEYLHFLVQKEAA